ncbi:MAG: Rho termination factor N-terminal domain-containing protein, partial [Thermovirgaceae bacterium]
MADNEAVDTRAQAEGARENGQGGNWNGNGEARKVPRPKHSFGDLSGRSLTELRKNARQLKLPGASTLRKDDLVIAILKAQTESMGFRFGGGTLEVLPEGYGFLRPRGLLPSDHDIYVSASQVRRFGLRNGDLVWGLIRPPKDQEHYEALLRVEVVNFSDPEEARKRPHFERLTPIFPDSRMQLETKKHELTTRLIDLFAPIGKGQRALVVSPPKAGKTTVLKKIANAVTE